MKATGIVRRIDELGRIVIPKEMRKILKIKNGDNLEIFMNDGNIILNKLEVFDDKKELLTLLIGCISSFCKKNVIITDTSRIVAGNKSLIGCDISDDIDTLMFARTNKLEHNTINITSGIKTSNYCFSSIVSNSDVCGVVIIYDDDVSNSDFEICKFVSKFLAKYLED